MSKDLNITMLFDFYRNILTDKQIEVVDLYYNEDLSLAEISEHLGITRQGVRDNIKRAEAILLHMEEKLGLAARYRTVRRAAAGIAQELHEMETAEQAAEIAWLSEHTNKIKAYLAEIEDAE